MSPQDIRETLIKRTVSVIASEGLDKTTTKAITSGTGINEVYIYRHFSGKDALLSKTFEILDHELLNAVSNAITPMSHETLGLEVRCRLAFDKIWSFLVSNKERCLAYVRYYYSPYFLRYSAEQHKQIYRGFTERISVVFKEEADVWMILNHILNVLLDFACKVHNGQMSEDDDYSEHVFRVLYRAVEQYFKHSEESSK